MEGTRNYFETQHGNPERMVESEEENKIRMAESEVETSYENNSMDDRERGGSQLLTQQYIWTRARWKPTMGKTVRLAESD